MKRSPIIAVILALATFVVAIFISKGIIRFVPNPAIWYQQVLLKALLILLSIAAIKFVLKISLAEAGFKKSTEKWKKGKIIFSGMGLGAAATILIFFTPAEGVPLVKQLNVLEFLLVVIIWSSIAEEIFIRGFLQSYLKPLEQNKVNFLGFQCSVPVLTCALIFSGMHLSLLFAGADYYTVVFTLITTFLLGLLAGLFREKYDSVIPSVITHMLFNVGGILAGIVIAILFKIITGELPPH